jgi:hypothetical protein
MAMVGAGGSLGTSLLLGSGAAVRIAGPAVILSFDADDLRPFGKPWIRENSGLLPGCSKADQLGFEFVQFLDVLGDLGGILSLFD